MIIYFTTAREQILSTSGVIPCPDLVCRAAGHTEPHLCFAAEPLSGRGQYVFSVDVPLVQLEKYEYKNEFLAEKTRFFALPAKMVEGFELTRSTFEEVTGRPWNRWTVPVLDRRAVGGHAHLKGKWAIIWASREGVASGRVYRRLDDQFLSVEITLTTDFDTEKDYLVIEQHEESERVAGVGQSGVKETWHLETWAGIAPQWAIFPTLWQEWVWDRKVTRSATEYIIEHVPSVRKDVDYAMQKDSKQNKARAWRLVADEVGRVLSARVGERVDLGKLGGHSWTAVAAMPHRIANRMSQHLPYSPWHPPQPQPEFADPNLSGRYALANLYGVYPRSGPGVDHAPQERPFTGREGELDRTDFRLGQSAPALALA